MARHLRWGRIARRVRDVMATRTALLSMLGGLIFLCFLASAFMERSVRQLTLNQQVFSDREIRNGFVSMSDLQRLMAVAQEGAVRGGLDAAGRDAFIEATDILFVRRDFFAQNVTNADAARHAEDAIAALSAMIAIADAAIQSDFAAMDQTWLALVPVANEARRALVQFQEVVTRFQNTLMQDQAEAVRQQRLVLLSALVAVSVIGAAAILLLRREVMTRLAQERAEQHVEFLAYYDPLTKLPNRAQFQKRLDNFLLQAEPIALVLLDLDEFKTINDTYGHAAGDAVLMRVGQLLQVYAAQCDGFAARLGGDEFAMVLRTGNVDSLISTCELLLQEAREGLSFEGEAVQIGLSIGFVTSVQLGPDVPRTVDALCRVADFALYSSKTSGRGRLTQYNRVLEVQYFERRTVVDSLPRAIGNDELDVYLQPKVMLPGQEVYGFEALVRWVRQDRMIQPQELIRIAEESGLIFELDRYVLDVATREIGIFNRANEGRLAISVNLSALHFNSSRIAVWVEKALLASGLSPELLTLEITETAELRDWEKARRIIGELRNLGVRISIDDFGTGYSSLSYLRSAIVDEVKIDRSIVDQIETSDEARFLLDGILDIAGNLGLGVVVEGVETPAQASILNDMGAERAQGFLFGRPAPLREAMEALKLPPPKGRRSGTG